MEDLEVFLGGFQLENDVIRFAYHNRNHNDKQDSYNTRFQHYHSVCELGQSCQGKMEVITMPCFLLESHLKTKWIMDMETHEKNTKCSAQLNSYCFMATFPRSWWRWGVCQWVETVSFLLPFLQVYTLTVLKHTIARTCLPISFHRAKLLWPFPSSQSLCILAVWLKVGVPMLCTPWSVVTHEAAVSIFPL